MKELYVIRHGEAAFGAGSDFNRELTEYGQQQVEETAQALKKHLDKSDKKHTVSSVIWASPLVRAQQSAKIIANVINFPVETKTFITPNDIPGESLEKIYKETNASRLVLVTHMPFCADLAAILTDDRSFQAGFTTAECQFFKCTDFLPACGTFISRIL